VRNALDAAPEGPWLAALPAEGAGEAIARIESPQGELLYAVRLDGGLRRVAIRSASFQNWPLFVPALPGNIFTDFSFIEHSFGLIVAETDR
jgi:Ni,Fe-hydrogenase III large subunit